VIFRKPRGDRLGLHLVAEGRPLNHADGVLRMAAGTFLGRPRCANSPSFYSTRDRGQGERLVLEQSQKITAR
jgi:hypothetical protein